MPLEENENFFCPYCGEENPLVVDLSAGPSQEFVVDCTVCCAPIVVRLKVRGDEIISLDVQPENG
jgi:transcription elongation factor Elf1